MADLSGSWMTGFSVNLLAHVANVASGADRLRPVRRADKLPPAFPRPAPAATTWVDLLPERGEASGPQSAAGRNRNVVLGQELFRSALSRERRRADRFDEFFAVGTIAVDPALAALVAAALNVATRETDVVGWIEDGRVLGVILSGVRPTDEVARHMEARLQRELVGSLDAGAIDRLNVCWYVHAGPGAQGAPGLCDADPLLDDLRSAERRRSVMDGCKRALDLLGSIALLALLAPVFLILAALVKLTSHGPILFRQVRVGQLAKPFTMLKFRTMHMNNDCALHQQFVTEFIKSSDQQKQAGANTFFKIRNDPRVTPIGHFLRRTSLDELPQLWNVFRGDMSLVGPRPPLRYELEQYRPWHWRRVLEGKPGVTGLWQVAGRSRTTFDEMVRMDLRYVRTRSLWTDIRILLATPRAVVTGRGAC